MLRSYSISDENDAKAIALQICPDYSLNWSLQTHESYWPAHHDFLTAPPLYKASKPHYEQLRKIQVYCKMHSISKPVFCDLDGVLVDFNKGVATLTGRLPDQLDAKRMWTHINRAPGFYSNLEWLPDGQRLWNWLKDNNCKPVILTGANTKRAAAEKLEWCAKHLGPDVPVICCQTKNKPDYCIDRSILIDDRDIVKESWDQQGGTFVHYLNATQTIEELTNKLR